MKRRVLILLGPQGVGKSTAASLLARILASQGWRVISTRAIYQTLLYHGFSRFIAIIVKANRVLSKFYEDDSPKMVPNPEIIRRLRTLYIILHVLGLIISVVKIALLCRAYNLVIEEEGFLFKDINVLFSLLLRGKARGGTFPRLLELALRLIARWLKPNCCIVRLTAPHAVLRGRYSLRGTHIEPRHYVQFQEVVYNVMQRLFSKLFVAVIDTSKSGPLEVAREVARAAQLPVLSHLVRA
jgi:energy-coupling factor transporter ATP-binding protein EcfA2